jgi:hypothetical protein
MGSSLYTWARAVHLLSTTGAEVHCVDAWEEVEHEQYNKSHMARELIEGVAHRVFKNTAKLVENWVSVLELKGMSCDVLPNLSKHYFDIVYIDACHLHPEVLTDIKHSHELLAVGGYMCGDDLEKQLHEVDQEHALTHVRDDYVRDPKTDLSYHPGVTLGVGEFFGAVSVYQGFWIMQKTDQGYAPVNMSGFQGVLPIHWPPEYVQLADNNIKQQGLITILS